MDQIDGCEAEEGAVSDTRKPADGGHEGCQRPRGRHKCQVQVQLVLSCSCDEKQGTGTLVLPPTMEFQDACRRCRVAGSHLVLGWCLELTAAASAEQPKAIMCGIAHPDLAAAAPNHPITTSLSTTPIVVRQQLHTYIHPHYYTTTIN